MKSNWKRKEICLRQPRADSNRFSIRFYCRIKGNWSGAAHRYRVYRDFIVSAVPFILQVIQCVLYTVYCMQTIGMLYTIHCKNYIVQLRCIFHTVYSISNTVQYDASLMPCHGFRGRNQFPCFDDFAEIIYTYIH